jgi:hypothetical protein
MTRQEGSNATHRTGALRENATHRTGALRGPQFGVLLGSRLRLVSRILKSSV